MWNWHDLLPEPLARYQYAWERRQMIKRAVDAGVMQKDIAAKLQLSCSRVHQMYIKAKEDKISPAQWFCTSAREFPELLMERPRAVRSMAERYRDDIAALIEVAE